MKPVFADTSYYLALVNSTDPRHQLAVDLGESQLGRIFVTEYVLVELCSAMSCGTDRGIFLELLGHLQGDRSTTSIAAGQKLFGQGLALFASRPDKDWSVVDCISFVVMKQHRLKEALTTDRHFDQAGFRALLRENGRLD